MMRNATKPSIELPLHDFIDDTRQNYARSKYMLREGYNVSHIATNWAFQVKGLKPATKIVLLQLADRHNPDFGCFPSIARLSIDCEMSPRSIHSHIDELENLGLILRKARHRDNGQQSSNEYILNFDSNRVQNLHPYPAKSAPPPPQNLQTNNLVRYNHVILRKNMFENFDDAWEAYPKKQAKGASKKAFEKAVTKINPNELLDRIKEYAQAISGQDIKYIPMLSTWLNQERWGDDLPQPNQSIDHQFRNMVNDLARAR